MYNLNFISFSINVNVVKQAHLQIYSEFVSQTYALTVLQFKHDISIWEAKKHQVSHYITKTSQKGSDQMCTLL